LASTIRLDIGDFLILVVPLLSALEALHMLSLEHVKKGYKPKGYYGKETQALT
jgi:hypothetical protein